MNIPDRRRRGRSGPLDFRSLAILSLCVVALVTPSFAGCWTQNELAGKKEELATLRGEAAKHFRAVPVAEWRNVTKNPLPENFRGLITRVAPAAGRKPVALTFDLCEGGGERAGYDGRIIDFLRAEGIPATFFMGGKWARSHETRAMQLLTDPLFEVGNHSFSHPRLPGMNLETLKMEILGTEAEFDGLLAKYAQLPCAREGGEVKLRPKPHLFRFPYGESSVEAQSLLADYGLAAIQWDVAPGDPSAAASAGELARDVLRNAKPGSIVVLHANGKGVNTAEALETLVPELKRRGFAFVTVGEMLNNGTPARK